MKILDRFGVGSTVQQLVSDAESSLGDVFRSVEKTAEFNQYKVIDAFREENIGARHFCATNGYGYADEGRSALARVFARITRAESAVLSPHIASGTHAIALALYAVMRPLDTLISVTGRPYDTLNHVIGTGGANGSGSLADFAVGYAQVDLDTNGAIDIDRVIETISKCDMPKAVFLQRSRGYEWRKALSLFEIREFVLALKRRFPDIIVIADNCYGEFCETEEPIECGADLIAGSMIKNPGGGIAPTGGYIAGRADLVALAENRLTCPGLGCEVGSYEASYRPFFQGAVQRTACGS